MERFGCNNCFPCAENYQRVESLREAIELLLVIFLLSNWFPPIMKSYYEEPIFRPITANYYNSTTQFVNFIKRPHFK